MKLIVKLSVALLVFCAASAHAQQKTYAVKGTVTDSVINANLVNASVSVLNAKDSTLRKFTRVDKSGAFSIESNLSKGSFILLITYPGYADYVENFKLDSVNTTRNFGRVNLLLKSRLLNEVIIKGKAAAIKIKGDTTEFNAKAFTIQPNSKVEDLLKQLPGIQVDNNGKITAQGQTVSKVLVDGEEFFGDDPTLVTKNIRGDMVDKVQLYDKKSDQATFTGIDDGERTKTINIKLKDDKKNGYFGKVDVGASTGDYYEGQAWYNRFKGKKKMSAYTTFGNTGKIGLGWEENNKLGTGGGFEFNDDGIMFIDGGDRDALDSFSGRYDEQGIPKAYTGGLHYDDKWKNDKYTINTNYKLGYLEVDGTRDTKAQQNLPGDSTVIANKTNIINTNTNETFNNSMFRQKLDAAYTIKLDTTSNLKLTVDGTVKHSDTHTTNAATSSRIDSTLININDRKLDNAVDQQLFNATAFYNKKLKKPGRTISLSLATGFTDSKADGNLHSRIDYFGANNNLISSQLIDQRKTDDTHTSKFNSNLTYTEPLSKALSLVLNYGVNLNNSNANRRSYDQSAPGVYNLLNDSLSNHYVYNQTSNQGGFNFNYKKGKATIRVGTRLANIHYKQVDLNNDSTGNTITRNFTNWSPQASINYKFSTYGATSINYNGTQVQPTINQLQPVRVNTDPTNIVIGNPNLKPSFRHSFFAYYNMYKVISDQSMYLYGNYSFTENPIVNNIVTDTTRATSTIMAVNLPNQRQSNYNLSLNANRKLGPMGVGVRFGTDGNVYYSLVNDQLNRTKSYNYNASLSVSKFKEKKYEMYITAGPTYTIGQASLQPNRNNNGRGFNGSYWLNFYLPYKFQLTSDGQYEYKAPTQSFSTDFRRTIINASISKSFFKSESLKLVVKGNDLLNQNSGFERSASSNLITENRYTTIRRYYMLSVVWDFNGMGGGVKKQ
jgi:hypothetical protein